MTNMHSPKPIRIRLGDVLLFIEAFLVVQPAILSIVFDDVLNYVLIFFLLLELALSKKIIKPSILVTLITVSLFYQLGVTLSLHSMGLQSAVMKAIPSFLCIIMIWRRIKVSNFTTIHVIALAFWWIIVINFLSVLLFPDGLTQGYSVSLQFHKIYFLGVDNQFGKILFPALAVIWFDEEYRKSNHHFASITAMILVLSTYLIRMSGGGLIATVLFAIFYIVYRLNNKSRIFSLKAMVIVLALLYVGIIGGSAFIYSNKLFANIAYAIGKNTTLTGRTNIWAVCLITFFKQPIFGMGWQLRDAVVAMSVPYSAHNRILQTLLEGGIIAGVLLGLQLVLAMHRCSETAGTVPSIKILSVGIFITFIYFIVETGTLTPIYIVITIIAMVSELDTKQQSLSMSR